MEQSELKEIGFFVTMDGISNKCCLEEMKYNILREGMPSDGNSIKLFPGTIIVVTFKGISGRVIS